MPMRSWKLKLVFRAPSMLNSATKPSRRRHFFSHVLTSAVAAMRALLESACEQRIECGHENIASGIAVAVDEVGRIGSEHDMSSGADARRVAGLIG